MKVPVKLLKEFIQLKETPQELASLLTMHCTPVEGIIGGKATIKNVVVGFIKTIEKHPNADRLQICKVDVGQKEPVQILTAATNVHQGLKVPAALVGAELAGGFQIKEAVMRGEKSFGMLCSEKELGLAEESSGILILPQTAPVGKNIVEYLGLDEVVLDVEVIPNRPDLLSVVGIAREFSAILKRPLKEPHIETPKRQSTSKNRSAVYVKDHDACPRYMAVLIESVKIAPSPEWMQRILKSAGIRPINNVVDVTNYVQLELGQPLHAFSFDKVDGGQLNVRYASDKEKITTLDGVERELDKNTLVIADRNKPQALAGIMGGAGSEVRDDTRTIILESAMFNSVLIRKTAKRYGLHTESSVRFSKGVDWHGVQKGLFRAVQLIKETASGEVVSEIFDKKKKDPEPIKKQLRIERASHVIGMKVSEADVVEILRALGFTVNSLGDRVDVIVPSWRAEDITREIDIIEELARVIGYNKVISRLPAKQIAPENITPAEKTLEYVRSSLLGSGLNEIITYSITSPDINNILGLKNATFTFNDQVTLENPLSKEMSVLRPSLLPGLISALERNWYRQIYDIKVFEIGTVFAARQEQKSKEIVPPQETRMVAGIICGGFLDRPWTDIKNNDIDFFALKGVVEDLVAGLGINDIQYSRSVHPILHPGKSADIPGVGVFGEIHPSILRKLGILKKAYAFELNLDALASKANFVRVQKAIPDQPYSRRDIAFTIPVTVEYNHIEDAIRSLQSSIIVDHYLFDRYQGEQIRKGYASLALAIHYQAKDRTLTDQEVEAEHKKVIKKLQDTLKVEIRS